MDSPPVNISNDFDLSMDYDRPSNDIIDMGKDQYQPQYQPPEHLDDDFDKSVTEDVIYDINESSQFNETRALFIGNLRAPFDHNDLRDILNKYCELGGCTVERAWLNSKHTHSIVIASDVPGAESIRKNLNGKLFPIDINEQEQEQEQSQNQEQRDRLPLYIDYIPVKATQFWIDQENRGPNDAIWKVSYTEVPSKKQIGTTFTVATHKMLNYPNETWGYKSSSRHRGNGSGGNRRGNNKNGLSRYNNHNHNHNNNNNNNNNNNGNRYHKSRDRNDYRDEYRGPRIRRRDQYKNQDHLLRDQYNGSPLRDQYRGNESSSSSYRDYSPVRQD